jgi:hypothetical protein
MHHKTISAMFHFQQTQKTTKIISSAEQLAMIMREAKLMMYQNVAKAQADKS